MRPFARRILRVFRLDPDVFEEVEHDHGAGVQAFLVVLLASIAGGVGNLAAAALLGSREIASSSLLVLAAFFLVAWIAWSFVTMAVGTRLFGGRADMGEMQRALGFAAAPGLLMIVPGLGLMIGVPWSLVAMIVAVRQACDFTTARALWTIFTSATVVAAVALPAACAMLWRG